MGFFVSLSVQGQEPWSLDRCIAYAREHATEVRRQTLEQEQKHADYRTALLDFLPSVSAEVNGQYSWGRNIDPETNTYNNVTTFNNYYALGASVTLFDGGATWNAFQQARLDRASAQSAIAKASDDKAMSVMEKYVDAVYTRRTIALAEEKLSDSKALLMKTRRMFDLGEKSRPDVVQVESQVAEDEYNLLHQRNLADKALADLKTAMNYPTGDTLLVAGLPVDVAAAAMLPANRRACDSLMQSGYFLADRPAVAVAEAAAERARLAWKIQRAALLPKLTLSGGVATNYYKNLTAGGQAEGFGSQFRNNMGESLSSMLRRGTRSAAPRPTGRKHSSMWPTRAANSTTMPCRLSSTTVATPARWNSCSARRLLTRWPIISPVANTRKACSASSTCTPPRRPCCKAACSCCKAR